MPLDSTSYELPPLPYAYDALPGISRATMELHHGKHHRAYVARLNALIAGSALDGRALADVVRLASGPLLDHAAQAWNHAFFWRCLTPERGTAPGGALLESVQRDFASVDRLLAAFRASAVAKFGSGWTWLVLGPDGRLAVENTSDADTPLRHGRAPLLACDVWEHAYYLDYRNERPRYVDAFLALVNWQFVAQNLAAATAALPQAGPVRAGN